jgi:repressor LexA
LHMRTRTRRQREVLDFITEYIERHGYEPSYQVIARHLGVNSKAGIGKHVKALEDQGLLHRRRENGSFSLVLGRSYTPNGHGPHISWLETADRGDELEDWETKPIAIPPFMLGGIEPDSLAAFRVNDEGMTGRGICEGDVVLFERRPHARDGKCVVATIDGARTLLRKLYRIGADHELRPENEDIEPIQVPADKVEIHGVFRALLRPAN